MVPFSGQLSSLTIMKPTALSTKVSCCLQFPTMTRPSQRRISDEAAAQGDAFLVLRNKTRLRIIHLLRRYGGLLCVSEIAEALDEHPSVISNHLAILRAAEMVSRNTYQTYAYYSLTEGAMEQYN